MNKIELLIIKLVLWILIPGLFFFIFWWAAGSLAIYQIYPISDNQIALFSISGLCIGLCFVFLTRNILLSRFYNIGFWLLILFYLICSAICFGVMMGFPVGNLILGGLAGFYIGRRMKHAQINPTVYLTKTGLFTAIMTGIWVLIISVLAFKDEQVSSFLGSNIGFIEEMMHGPIEIILIALISLAVGFVQFYLTRFTGRLSLKL